MIAYPHPWHVILLYIKLIVPMVGLGAQAYFYCTLSFLWWAPRAFSFMYPMVDIAAYEC